jgi:hypothetical protein
MKKDTNAKSQAMQSHLFRVDFFHLLRIAYEYFRDCCCCSYPMITGFVIGLLICVVGLAPALTILLIKSGRILFVRY